MIPSDCFADLVSMPTAKMSILPFILLVCFVPMATARNVGPIKTGSAFLFQPIKTVYVNPTHVFMKQRTNLSTIHDGLTTLKGMIETHKTLCDFPIYRDISELPTQRYRHMATKANIAEALHICTQAGGFLPEVRDYNDREALATFLNSLQGNVNRIAAGVFFEQQTKELLFRSDKSIASRRGFSKVCEFDDDYYHEWQYYANQWQGTKASDYYASYVLHKRDLNICFDHSLYWSHDTWLLGDVRLFDVVCEFDTTHRISNLATQFNDSCNTMQTQMTAKLNVLSSQIPMTYSHEHQHLRPKIIIQRTKRSVNQTSHAVVRQKRSPKGVMRFGTSPFRLPKGNKKLPWKGDHVPYESLHPNKQVIRTNNLKLKRNKFRNGPGMPDFMFESVDAKEYGSMNSLAQLNTPAIRTSIEHAYKLMKTVPTGPNDSSTIAIMHTEQQLAISFYSLLAEISTSNYNWKKLLFGIRSGTDFNYISQNQLDIYASRYAADHDIQLTRDTNRVSVESAIVNSTMVKDIPIQTFEITFKIPINDDRQKALIYRVLPWQKFYKNTTYTYAPEAEYVAVYYDKMYYQYLSSDEANTCVEGINCVASQPRYNTDIKSCVSSQYFGQKYDDCYIQNLGPAAPHFVAILDKIYYATPTNITVRVFCQFVHFDTPSFEKQFQLYGYGSLSLSPSCYLNYKDTNVFSQINDQTVEVTENVVANVSALQLKFPPKFKRSISHYSQKMLKDQISDPILKLVLLAFVIPVCILIVLCTTMYYIYTRSWTALFCRLCCFCCKTLCSKNKTDARPFSFTPIATSSPKSPQSPAIIKDTYFLNDLEIDKMNFVNTSLHNIREQRHRQRSKAPAPSAPRIDELSTEAFSSIDLEQKEQEASGSPTPATRARSNSFHSQDSIQPINKEDTRCETSPTRATEVHPVPSRPMPTTRGQTARSRAQL